MTAPAQPAKTRRASTPPRETIRELIVDSFAGGGGASLGIKWALGRAPDYAINHDQASIEMHWTNHPDTVHYCESVWKVDPLEVTGNDQNAEINRHKERLWFSPHCSRVGTRAMFEGVSA